MVNILNRVQYRKVLFDFEFVAGIQCSTSFVDAVSVLMISEIYLIFLFSSQLLCSCFVAEGS